MITLTPAIGFLITQTLNGEEWVAAMISPPWGCAPALRDQLLAPDSSYRVSLLAYLERST